MNSDSDNGPDDLFNLENLRVRGDALNTINIEKLLTTVPVRKPDKQRFIRVHPGETHRLDAMLLELKDEGESYLVVPQLVMELPGARLVRLHLYVDRGMNPMIWWIPLPGVDGRDNPWHESARNAAERAMTHWVRIEADRSLGAYKVFVAKGEIEEPRWPKQSFSQLLRIGFGPDRYIRDRDHPVAKRLRGEI